MDSIVSQKRSLTEFINGIDPKEKFAGLGLSRTLVADHAAKKLVEIEARTPWEA